MAGMRIEPWTYYWLSVALLTVMLVWPVARMIWMMSVRRLERRRQAPVSEAERRGQRARAWFIGLIVSAVFALLFNFYLLDMGRHG